jgi:hypothetical protein
MRWAFNLGLVEGDGVHVPINLAAHYPGTAEPGTTGNAVYYAHAQPGMFQGLYRLHLGDEVRVLRQDGTQLVYHVAAFKKVAFNDRSVLLPTPFGELTRTSYDPYTPRFIVIATKLFHSHRPRGTRDAHACGSLLPLCLGGRNAFPGDGLGFAGAARARPWRRTVRRARAPLATIWRGGYVTAPDAVQVLVDRHTGAEPSRRAGPVMAIGVRIQFALGGGAMTFYL